MTVGYSIAGGVAGFTVVVCVLFFVCYAVVRIRQRRAASMSTRVLRESTVTVQGGIPASKVNYSYNIIHNNIGSMWVKLDSSIRKLQHNRLLTAISLSIAFHITTETPYIIRAI